MGRLLYSSHAVRYSSRVTARYTLIPYTVVYFSHMAVNYSGHYSSHWLTLVVKLLTLWFLQPIALSVTLCEFFFVNCLLFLLLYSVRYSRRFTVRYYSCQSDGRHAVPYSGRYAVHHSNRYMLLWLRYLSL